MKEDGDDELDGKNNKKEFFIAPIEQSYVERKNQARHHKMFIWRIMNLKLGCKICLERLWTNLRLKQELDLDQRRTWDSKITKCGILKQHHEDKDIMELYLEKLLRKPTCNDMEKLYAHHEEKHMFPGMLESINCTDWPWENCLVAFRAQFARAGKALDVLFVANNVTYKRGNYLTDEIYPQWSVLIKSIENPGANDHKRILYKTKHEATRKDVKRAFGVLKKKWKLLKHPTRGMTRRRLSKVMHTCIILHNMIIHDNELAISPKFFREEQHRDDDP
ncbi:ALP1-like protein [Tanacetum coccineum]